MSDSFPLTEAGDAEFFADAFGDQVRFDHRQRRWLIFGDHRWVPDQDGQRFRLGLQSMRARHSDTMMIVDPEQRKKHFYWTLGGESRRRLTNMLALAENISPISDSGDGWDANPWLLGVENGVLDLQTGDLSKGRPEDRITMSVRAAYEPSADCPLWTQTVNDVFEGNADVIAFVRRALGYSLTGDTREQCLFMNWGDGANGKSTLINTISYLLGDYAEDLPFNTLELELQRGGASNDLAKLVQKRFVTSSETNDGMRLNEARVKALTGGDQMTARFMYAEFFTFQPIAKFWLATNHLPIVADDSHGFWRRMKLIPFKARFSGTRDKRTLREDLKAEAPGILRWLVQGCIEWQVYGLHAPKTVTQATADYQAESNPVSAFIEEACSIDAKCRVGAQPLYDAYRAWAADNGVAPMNQKRFGQQIGKQFHRDKRPGSGKTTYVGIGLLNRESTSVDPLDPSTLVLAETSL